MSLIPQSELDKAFGNKKATMREVGRIAVLSFEVPGNLKDDGGHIIIGYVLLNTAGYEVRMSLSTGASADGMSSRIVHFVAEKSFSL